MVAILKKHKISVTDQGQTRTYFFLANPKTYIGIGNDCGVTEATDAEQIEGNMSVGEILGTGLISRAKIYFKVGDKRRSANVLIAQNRLAAFRRKMPGKPYSSGTVTSVRQPRRATSYF